MARLGAPGLEGEKGHFLSILLVEEGERL